MYILKKRLLYKNLVRKHKIAFNRRFDKSNIIVCYSYSFVILCYYLKNMKELTLKARSPETSTKKPESVFNIF